MHTLSDANVRILWIVLPVFLISFVGLWILIVVVVGYVSGWAALAGRYRREGGFNGQVWNWQSGSMRSANFNGCLTVGAGAEGLYLNLIAPLRIRNPALLIPWNEIAVSRQKRFLIDAVRLELGRELRIPLWIRPKLADRLRLAAAGYWPVESIG